MRSSHSLDVLSVQFDDTNLVANAGLLLPATLAQHLGLEELYRRHVRLGDAPGRPNAGIKAMTLIHSALAGGDCIDDSDVLRSGCTEVGPCFCYNPARVYPPRRAVAEDEVIHAGRRGGPANSTRGAKSFLAETFARVREAGYEGSIILRADSGFYNHFVTGACDRAKVRWSITAKTSPRLHRVIAAIPEEDWVPIPYCMDGAPVAETTHVPFSQPTLPPAARPPS